MIPTKIVAMVIVMMSMALTMMFGQAVGGVLLAGLIFGHFGFSMYAGMQIFGFALFIFCIGYQASPQFFDALLN